MEEIHSLMQGFAVALSLKNLGLMFVGVVLGVIIGVLPGLGGANGVIMETESTIHRNTSIMDGIVRSNAAAGIEDPTVFFVTVNDQHRCDECTRLHVQPDGITPRVWKLSELGAGYHKKGEENPKIGGLHPHCRCVLTTLLRGYGFSGAGRVQYIRPGHDEFAAQRGMEKSEGDFADLEKSDWQTRDFKAQLARYGWQFQRQGGDHEIWGHPGIPNARPIPFKHGHAHRIDKQMMQMVSKEAGLRWAPDGLVPDPKGIYAQHYQALGHLPSGPKSWESPGFKSVPIDSLQTSNAAPQPHIQHTYKRHFAAGQHHKVPVPEAYQHGDQYHVSANDEAVGAAREHGFTHVPVKVVGQL